MSKFIFNKAYAETLTNMVKDLPLQPDLDYLAARN